ncbi:MAG: ABC transporter permease [Solirubrobacterales bacterium]|nr:ABC transporter permease [Solirubrobacterales bacterium]
MIRAVLVAAVLLGAWELYCRLSGIDPLVLPAPHQVVAALWNDRSLLASDLLSTAGEVAAGLVAALLFALLAAISIHLSRTMRRSLYPVLVASQTLPIPVVASLLVVWLGYDLGPKVAIIALVAFFPVVVATLGALAKTDPELPRLVRALGAGRARTFWLVEAPAAIPGAFDGLRIAVVLSVIGAVFAEQAGSESGLGHTIQQALPQLLMSRAYAAVIVLSALALALFGLIGLIERLLVPWARVQGSQL